MRFAKGDCVLMVERLDKLQRRSMMEIRRTGTLIPLIPDMKTLPSNPNGCDACASAVGSVACLPIPIVVFLSLFGF